MIDNEEATLNLCASIASAFRPDRSAVRFSLINEGAQPAAEYEPKDARVFRAARRLVAGFVEGSRSEGGISCSVRSEQAIAASLRSWCRAFDLDPDVELADQSTQIRDASSRW